MIKEILVHLIQRYMPFQQNKLEYAVIEILASAGASDYVPLFARHRITIETMCQLTEDDIKQVNYCRQNTLKLHWPIWLLSWNLLMV